MFPTKEHPFDGIFIKEQIEELQKIHHFEYEVLIIDGIYKGKGEYLKSVFTIPKKIRAYNPDIIHIHYGISGLFLLFFQPKQKVFVTLHGSDFNDRGSNKHQVWVSIKVIKRANKVFVQNSEMLKNALIYNKNAEILTCGIDTEYFDILDDFDIPKNSKTIIFPSSPTREVKNYPLFCEVIEQIRKMSSYKIEVKHIENLNRDQVRETLNKADLLLLTSKTEGSPQSVKEALSCGLPVVSVPVGDVAEILSDIPNCHVSLKHDPKELAILALNALETRKTNIRNAFISKGHYCTKKISKKLAVDYGFQNMELL